MKLMRISGQSKEDLRQFYGVSHGWVGDWLKPIAAMLELVIYLEEAVDFPPQWVSTSHENLILVGQDDYRQGLVSIHPIGERHGGPAKARFEIHHPVEAPWSHAVGYAEDVEQAGQAGQMIISVLLKSSVEKL